MPPRKQKTKATTHIDPNKHAEALKAIEEEHRQFAIQAAEEEQIESEEGSEEESEAELEDEEIFSDIEPSIGVARIDLSFPETTAIYENSELCFPPSYYTLSLKERCLLLYAENFRKQFFFKNPQRRPLMLAPFNECEVQKFVCSTIRPTGFAYLPLIGNVQEIANFVADFIIYEPLEEPYKLPSHIISPDTLLRRRRGNCFEMASLLCSMLIGTGVSAFVVSGVAREDILKNNLENTPYPFEIPELATKSEDQEQAVVCEKYKLRPLPDLESHLNDNISEVIKEKETEDARVVEEAAQLERELEELRPVDRYHYRRTHAWVVIIDKSSWGHLLKEGKINEDVEANTFPRARFIEPATGFICETSCKNYILVDSVWNNYNYYVNLQSYQRVGEIKWDLRDTSNWEHLLPVEPPEMQVMRSASDENLVDTENNFEDAKHLDTIRSWVRKLYIGPKEFEERFPHLEKSIRFKRVVEERYSPYTQRDGKVKQITVFADDEYTEPLSRYDYFENRSDLLQVSKYVFDIQQMEESFSKGRKDSLKYMKYYPDSESSGKVLRFYSLPRLDSMKLLEIFPGQIMAQYDRRRDLLEEQNFEFKPDGFILKKAVEKFARNPEIPTYKDIAIRIFNLSQKKYFLQFHYSRGALTASTREFLKPPKPDYGQELKFDPSITKAYKANLTDPDPSALELHRLLLQQLEAEDKIKKQFERLMEQIIILLDQRKQEMRSPLLKFSIFDLLRNGAARTQALKQEEEASLLRMEADLKPPDFLAPYLIMFKGRQLTKDESWVTFKACLFDMKTRFVKLLNELQRQYEELTTESKAMKRFLEKFANQFNDYDYQYLTKQAKEIELNKRMVQQRLTITHEEAKNKYDLIKTSLLSDPRLSLGLERSEK